MQIPAYGAEPRRPYVRFERRSQETRDPAKPFVDKDWAITMAPGSKDTSEMLAEDWLNWLDKMATEERLPQSWPRQYREAYKEWQETQEQPTHGYPLLKWPPLTPAQRESCLKAGIRTVEDLAAANVEALGRIGMGGLALKQSAEAWLAEQKNGGALAQKVADLQIALEDTLRIVQELKDRNAELEAAQKVAAET